MRVVFAFLSSSVLLAMAAIAPASPGPQPLASAPAIPAPRDEPYPGTLRIAVDVSDVARRVYRVHEDIPVRRAGDLVLLYPRWLPGTHAPEGAIDRFAGLVVEANHTPLAWTRDPGDVYAFHVPVPAGARSISVDFQYLSPANHDVGAQQVGRELLVMDWVDVMLYPAGYFTRQIPVDASVRVPDGWRVATALDVASTQGAVTTFKTAPLETVGDSPVHAGRYAKRYDVTASDGTPAALDLMTDRADQLAIAPDLVERVRAIVEQATRLFGSHHYNHYDFLLELSDEVGENTTLEHHRSAEYGEGVDFFADWDKTSAGRDVLAHEYVHSWCGKFRRPADLWTPTYNVPMRNSLLWVYEGGTQYFGYLVTARSGVWTKQQALDAWAVTAASLDGQPGRTWRPLQDTTNDEIINPRRPMSWPSWQRFEEYYTEGALIWLDADTLIREKTGGEKSLDDFARAFFGVDNGSFTPEVYTFDDVVKALDGVYAYDWATFLRTRLDGKHAAPLDGIKRGGYHLAFDDKPSEYWQSYEEKRLKGIDDSYSIGVVIDKDNVLAQVVWDSPAAKAGALAGSKVLAVDGIAFEPGRLKAAIVRAAASPKADPIELLLQNGERFYTARITYHGGLRYPHLVRDPAQPALLDAILAPRKS